MQKKLILANLVIAALILCVVIFAFAGIIHFGHGYGDIIYVGFAVLSFLIHTVFFLSFAASQKATSNEYRTLLFIFFGVLLYLLYSFTIGRGPE